jgi:hypothetical protein
MKAFSGFFVAVAALFALTCVPVDAADYADTHWGVSVDGLKAGVRLDPIDRTEYHPGEVLNLVMEFDVELNHPLRVPLAALCEYTAVHVVGPDGREYIWDRGGTHHEDAAMKIDADDWEPFNDADEQPYTEKIRLAAGKQIWIEAKTDRTIPFSLIVPGTYRAWTDCKIVARKNPPKHAWQGTVKSGEVMWTMTELPVERRRNEVIDEQQRELDAWLALAKLKNEELGKPLTIALTQEVLLAENEGLAQKLVEIAKSGHAEAMSILLARTGDINDGQTGIDGPYLKQLAEYILEVDEKSDHQNVEADKSRSSASFDPVMLYLGYHPDDSDIHQKAVSALSDMARSKDSHTGRTSFWASVPYAWAALQKLGELKTGMTRQQAEDLLGPPKQIPAEQYGFGGGGGGGFGPMQAKPASATTSENPDKLQWRSALQPGAENPGSTMVEAQFKDGKTTAWKIYWPGEFRGKTPYGMPGGDPE